MSGGGDLGGLPLEEAFPVNSYMELKLSPDGEVVRGVVYCTDDTSNSVVLRSSLPHTTLAAEVRIINASCVTERRKAEPTGEEGGAEALSASAAAGGNRPLTAEEFEGLAVPLPTVTRRALEDRERRALRLAEESLAHVNRSVGPVGQAVFDRLLKACNEVAWRGKSVLVLNQIRVDPPYGPDDCRLVGGARDGADEAAARLHADSLERVKKIVASTPALGTG